MSQILVFRIITAGKSYEQNDWSKKTFIILADNANDKTTNIIMTLYAYIFKSKYQTIVYSIQYAHITFKMV